MKKKGRYPGLKKSLIKSNGHVRIFYVDGNYVRNNIWPDFTEGGHGYIYKFIPRDEVWIDWENRSEWKPIAIHELHERRWMAKGLDYEHAHDRANISEQQARHHPRLIKKILKAELGSNGLKIKQSRNLYPKRFGALKHFPQYRILKRHDDGDLTIKSDEKKFLVTTQGEIYEQLSRGNPTAFTGFAPQAAYAAAVAASHAAQIKAGVFGSATQVVGGKLVIPQAGSTPEQYATQVAEAQKAFEAQKATSAPAPSPAPAEKQAPALAPAPKVESPAEQKTLTEISSKVKLSPDYVRGFADQFGMSNTSALATIQRYIINPNAYEFRNMLSDQRQWLEAYATEAQKGYNRVATIEVPKEPPSGTAKIQNLTAKEYKEYKEYKDWTAGELLHGKVINGVSYSTPWGVKGTTDYGYPDWALEKIINAQISAFNKLKVYIEPGITKSDISKAISKGKPKAEIVKMINQLDQDIINVPKAAQAGNEAELRLLGVSYADIEIAKTIPTTEPEKKTEIPKVAYSVTPGQIAEIVKQTGKGMWESSTEKGETFSQGWQDVRTNKIITNEEYVKIPQNSAERDWYVRTSPENLVRGARLAAEVLVPGVYTVRHWNEMGAGGKAFSIAMDAIILVPGTLAAVGAARSIGTATTIGRRLAVVGRAAGEEVLRQVRAPVDVIVHPIESTKNIGRQIRSLYELINDPSRLPSFTLGTADGLVAFRVDKNTTKTEAMAIRDALIELSKAGHKPIVIAGGKKYELAITPIIEEQGGGLIHSGPDLGPLQEGTKVAYKEGLPLEEQGWFLSTGGAPRFVESSAFGKGTIPLPMTYDSKVREVAKYKPADLVRLDKTPIRDLNLADIESVPEKLAKPLENYIRNNDGRIAGSFVQWLKVKGAAKPHDLDLVFRDRHKAIDDLYNIAKAEGFTARKVTKGVEILRDKEWVRVAEVRSAKGYELMIPKGLTQAPNKINGINVTTLGEQYLRQSYGAITPDLKAGQRLKALKKASDDVKKMLTEARVEQRRPGYFIISRETAEKATPTGKLYKGIAEIEEKLKTGAWVPEAKQVLYTRLGPFSEKTWIFLEKPLSQTKIEKLKARGLIEWVQSPFKRPLKVSEISQGKSLSNSQVKQLSNALKQSGNIRQAENLIRAERIAMAPRRVAPTLARILGDARMARIDTRTTKTDITHLERARAEVERLEARITARPTREQARQLERVRAELSRAQRHVIDKVSRVKAETARTTPARTEPARAEAERASPARTKPTRAEPVRATTSRTTPPRETPPREAPLRETPLRTELPRAEKPRIEEPRKPPPRIEQPRTKINRIDLRKQRIDLTKQRIDLLKGNGKKEWTPNEVRSAVAFVMGQLKVKDKLEPMIIARKDPYRESDIRFFIGDTPEGMKVYPDQASALKTIQLLQAKRGAKIDFTGRQGFATYRVKAPTPSPGRPGAISFGATKRIPDQTKKIARRLSTGGQGLHNLSRRKGKLHRTRVDGGTLLSYEPVRGR